MPKYLYLIVNLDNGEVTGTNETDLVQAAITDESFVVVKSLDGVYYSGDWVEHPVEEFELESEGDEGEGG